MRPYLDTNLINNSSLACFILVNFIKQYEEVSMDERKPDLIKLLLILPFAWHETSRSSIKGKKSSTPLKSLLLDSPLVKSNIRQRVSAYSGVSIQGLNLASACGLISKIEQNGNTLFKSNFNKWPKGSKPSIPVEMTQTTKRLAGWFSEMDTPALCKILFGD